MIEESKDDLSLQQLAEAYSAEELTEQAAPLIPLNNYKKRRNKTDSDDDTDISEFGQDFFFDDQDNDGDEDDDDDNNNASSESSAMDVDGAVVTVQATQPIPTHLPSLLLPDTTPVRRVPSESGHDQSYVSDITPDSMNHKKAGRARTHKALMWIGFTHVIVGELQQAVCRFCPTVYNITEGMGSALQHSCFKTVMEYGALTKDDAETVIALSKAAIIPKCKSSSSSTGSVSSNSRPELIQQKIVLSPSGDVLSEDTSYTKSKARTRDAEMIILDQLPFTHVEGEGFKNHCLYLNYAHHSMSAKTVKSDIGKMFNSHYEYVKNMLKAERESGTLFNLGTDIWAADHQNIGYIVTTIRYLTADFELRRFVLGFHQMDTRHTADNIQKQILKICNRFNITDSILSVMVDNAASNTCAINTIVADPTLKGKLAFGGVYLHGRCVAHILHHLVTDVLAIVNPQLEEIRKVLGVIKSSEVNELAFKTVIAEAIQELIGSGHQAEADAISGAWPHLDVHSRWNSTYYMLKAIIPFQKALTKFAAERCGFVFTEEMFSNFVVFRDFLEPFRRYLLVLSDSKVSNLDKVYGLLTEISEHIHGIAFDPLMKEIFALVHWSADELVCFAALSTLQKYNKYFGGKAFPKAFVIGHILDPRWRLTYISDVCGDEYATAFNTFAKLYLDFYSTIDVIEVSPHEKKIDKSLFCNSASPFACSESVSSTSDAILNTVAHPVHVINPNPPSASASAAAAPPVRVVKLDAKSWFKAKMQSKTDSRSKESPLQELLDYLRYDKVIEDGFVSSLHWWKTEGKSLFPRVALMAQHFLSMECTSMHSESTFSKSDKLLTSHRSCLNPDTVEVLMLCDSFLRAGKEYGWKLNHDLFPEINN